MVKLVLNRKQILYVIHSLFTFKTEIYNLPHRDICRLTNKEGDETQKSPYFN